MENKLLTWIQESLNTKINTITLEDVSEEKNQGFTSDIYFVKVSTDKKEEYLVVKVGKTDPEFRKKWPMTAASYKREIDFYKKIIPGFEHFQKLKNLNYKFSPKCHKTFINDNEKVIILENLKRNGYKIHNRKIPMDLEHLKIVFKNLAKYHALSFGIQNENKSKYELLTSDYKCLFFIGQLDKREEAYLKVVEKVVTSLEEFGKENLAIQFQKLVKNGITNIILEILKDAPKEKVILHGDPYNNNLLFKYQDEDRNNPIDVLLIDFQLSFIHSPVLDLCYTWYFSSSKEVHAKFEELIEYYHQELSSFLTQLGGNPEKIFPLSSLWQHWKKYSFYGMIMATIFMDLLFIEEDKEIKDKSSYVERVCDGLEHFLNFKPKI